VQLLLAIDQRKRAMGVALPASGHSSSFSLASTAARMLKTAVRAVKASFSQRPGASGPPVERLQFLVHRLAFIYGLEHIVEQFDACVSTRTPTSAGSDSSSVQQSVTVLHTRARGEFSGLRSHIPVRQDELAWLVLATQAWSTSLLQAVLRCSSPGAMAALQTGAAEISVFEKEAQWLVTWTGCSLQTLATNGSAVLTPDGVKLKLQSEEGCELVRSIAPNFLRPLARWRLAMVVLAAFAALCWAIGGPHCAGAGMLALLCMVLWPRLA
jgi:hypothetical protein